VADPVCPGAGRMHRTGRLPTLPTTAGALRDLPGWNCDWSYVRKGCTWLTTLNQLKACTEGLLEPLEIGRICKKLGPNRNWRLS